MENQPFEPRLIDALVREDRVHRRLFTDPAIFELEIEKIFHGTWVYVCHEAEIPQPGDFRRGRVGLEPGADGGDYRLAGDPVANHHRIGQHQAVSRWSNVLAGPKRAVAIGGESGDLPPGTVLGRRGDGVYTY